MVDIEAHSSGDPWQKFPALKALLSGRIDWDTGKPMIDIELERCFAPDDDDKKKTFICQIAEHIKIGPKDIEDASIFDIFSYHWPEEGWPLVVKKQQLVDSFMNSSVLNILNNTWEYVMPCFDLFPDFVSCHSMLVSLCCSRPLIKHVIMVRVNVFLMLHRKCRSSHSVPLLP